METPVAISEYVALVDRWRQEAAKVSNKGLARLIGGDKAEWSRIRRSLRQPRLLFHTRVLAKAEEPWKSALEQKWQRVEQARRREIETRLSATGRAA